MLRGGLHLLVGLQPCGCGKELLGGRGWSGKCPLLPRAPGFAVTLKHSWTRHHPENSLALPVYSYEPQAPHPPPSLGVDLMLPDGSGGLSIITGTRQGMTRHCGMGVLSSQTLSNNRPAPVVHMALSSGR